MGVKDAVIEVLKEAGSSLPAKEITERIISRGLWETNGKTPVATVSATLYSDIKKHGEASAFILDAPQTFSLREAKTSAETAVALHPEEFVAPTSRPSVMTYSFTDSAKKVLEEFGQKQPMHYRAITEKALEAGWFATEGSSGQAGDGRS